MVIALLLECCSFTGPADMNTSVTLLEFMGPKVVTAFGLIEMAIVFSLLNYAIPQILTGTFAGIWAGFICRHILQGAGDTTKYFRVSVGPGVYVFILSAGLILASGIVFAVIHSKSKVYGAGDRIAKVFKKLEVFCSVSLGLSIVIICIFELLKNRP